MTRRRRLVAAAIAIAVLCGAAQILPARVGPFPATPVALAEGPLGQREVEEALTCQCGCGLTVATCNHLECSFAVPVRKDVAESLARGETGEQILDRYKREYGEKVLSSPVPEGFNLLAWIAPYLVIAIAGTVMFVFFRRRAAVASPAGSAEAGPDRHEDASGDPRSRHQGDSRLEQLNREVEDLEQ